MLSVLVSANGLKNEIYSCVVRLFREESYNRKNRNNRRIVPNRKIGESEESCLKTHFLLFSDLTIIGPFCISAWCLEVSIYEILIEYLLNRTLYVQFSAQAEII